MRELAKSNQYCWKPAKVTTPSKFCNQFYLVATSSPWKPVLSTGKYVFDSTINVLMIFFRITCENCPILCFVVWQVKQRSYILAYFRDYQCLQGVIYLSGQKDLNNQNLEEKILLFISLFNTYSVYFFSMLTDAPQSF